MCEKTPVLLPSPSPHRRRRPLHGRARLAVFDRARKRVAQRERGRLQVDGRLPQGGGGADVARRLDAQVDHFLGGVRDGVAAKGDVGAGRGKREREG